MNKLMICLTTLMVVLIMHPAAGKAAGKKDTGITKLGVIDTAKILRTSRAAKNAQAIFLKDLEAKRGILAAKEKNVRLLDEELKNPDSKLSPEERSVKTDNLAREVKELNRLRSDLDEELQKKNAELTQKIIADLRVIVNTFYKRENYTLILDKNAVVAYDNAIDITDKIIQIYDGQKK